MQMEKVAALVDTGARFTCIRVELAEFARSMGHRVDSSPVLLLVPWRTVGNVVTETVKLHVKLLSFWWDHEFKVLKGVFSRNFKIRFFGIHLNVSGCGLPDILLCICSRRDGVVWSTPGRRG